MNQILKSFCITLGSLILACGAILGCYFAIKGVANAGTPGLTEDTNPASIVSQELSLDQMANAFKDLDDVVNKGCPNSSVAIRSTRTTIVNSKTYQELAEMKCANGIVKSTEFDRVNGDYTEYSDLRNVDTGVIFHINYDETDAKWYKTAQTLDDSAESFSYAEFFEANKDKFIYNEDKGAYIAKLSETEVMTVKFIKGKVVYFEMSSTYEGVININASMLYNHGKVSVTLPEAEIRG